VQLDVAGDLRGVDAVDLQATRVSSNQVAGGDRSVILGGQNNSIAVPDAVAFGVNNTLDTIAVGSLAGGIDNTVSASYSIAVGFGNTIDFTAIQSTAAFGQGNKVSKTGSVTVGANNWIAGQEGLCVGSNCKVDTWRGVAFGDHARAFHYGQLAQSNGPDYSEQTLTPDGADDFNQQRFVQILWGKDRTGGMTNLASNGTDASGNPKTAGSEFTIPADYLVTGMIELVARNSDGTINATQWWLVAIARAAAAAAALVGTPTKLHELNPSAIADPNITASGNALRIQVPVRSGNPKRYHATIYGTYLRYKDGP